MIVIVRLGIVLVLAHQSFPQQIPIAGDVVIPVEEIFVNIDTWKREIYSDHISWEIMDPAIRLEPPKTFHPTRFPRVDELDGWNFTQSLDEAGQPDALGTLDTQSGGESNRVCWRSHCHSDIHMVSGTFRHGMLNGKAKVVYQDGSQLVTIFKDSIPHGLFIQRDEANKWESFGMFLAGEKHSGPIWMFDQRTKATFTGQASGTGPGCFFFHTEYAAFCGEMMDFILTHGKTCSHLSIGREGSFLSISPVKCTSSPEELEFKDHQNFDSFEAKISAQCLWLSLRIRYQGQGLIIGNSTLEQLKEDAPHVISSIGRITPETVRCRGNLNIWSLPKDSIHEHLALSYPGSGSKWIFQSISYATGIKDYYLWLEHGPSYVRNSASLIKSHHQRAALYQRPDGIVNRKSEALTWRLDHIQFVQGRAILLIRNPYDAIRSHWDHVLAGELDLDRTSVQSLKEDSFYHFAQIEISLWLEMLYDWVPISPNLLVIHFEEFKHGMGRELDRVLRFFDVPADPLKLYCLAKIDNSIWKRRKSAKISIADYPVKIQELFNAAIDEANMLLKRHGLTELPLSLYSFYDVEK